MYAFLSFLLTIFILVGIHELGHFLAAKCMGVKVLRFSIGFGKPMLYWKSRKQGTEYALGWFPLGGYVRLLDSREQKEPVSAKDLPHAFDYQAIWRRAMIILAGPVINFLFGILAFYLVFTIGMEVSRPVIGEIVPRSVAFDAKLKPGVEIKQINGIKVSDWGDASVALILRLGNQGKLKVLAHHYPKGEVESYSLDLSQWKIDALKPQLLKSIGIVPFRPQQPAEINKLVSNGPAAKAGLSPGDQIISVNGEVIKDWEGLVKKIWDLPDKEVLVKVSREDKQLDFYVALSSRFSFKKLKEQGFIGIVPKAPIWPEGMRYTQQYSLLGGWWPAVKETGLMIRLNAVTLGKMVIGKVSFKSLGGPLTIYQAADMAFKQGLVIFLNFLAIVSVMLGFINLIPIPGLDGSQLLYLIIEKVRGKRMSAHLELLIARLGFIALALLIAHVTLNDLARFFA